MLRAVVLVATFLLLLSAAGTVCGQDPAPSAPPTIWNALGFPQGIKTVQMQLFNRRGNFPGLEGRPPLKAIADPANLESEVPAIKAAAEIKQAEDLKAQKIKAIKYLASIGCGCYDKDGKVTNALLAAMDDCTEEVRLATVEAIAEAAESESCVRCSQTSCCNEQIALKLATLAYERDARGCFVEPSERVRRAAADALRICCPYGPLPGSPTPLLPPNLPAIEGGDPPPRLESAFLRSAGYVGVPYYTPSPAVRYLDRHYWSAGRTLELEAQRTRR